VPLTWNDVVPSGVNALALTVSVLLMIPFGGGVTSAGLNAQAAPVGSGPQESATGELNALIDVTRQVVLALPPCPTDRLDGVQDTVKSRGSTLTDRVALRVSAPLAPVTWNVRRPPGVADDVLKVSVLLTVPLGGGVTGVALKAHAAPAGNAPQVRSTGALNPFCDVIVHVVVALSPWITVKDGGEQATENVGASTVSDSFAPWLRLPLAPTTRAVVVPAGVVPATLTVSVAVVEPLGSGVTVGGAKLQAASVGSEAHDRATSELKALTERMVHVVVALLPWMIVSDDGLQATVKSGSVDTVGVTSTQLLTGL
jgi:hypothetical protein